VLTPEKAPPRPTIRQAAVTTVGQVLLRLERNKPDPFKSVQNEVLDWIRLKAGKPLPREAWEGQAFELDDIGAQRVAASHLDEPRYWAARIDDACREVPQRTWITEVGLAEAPFGSVLFGCRLIVSARGDNPWFQPSIPAFVRRVIEGGAAFLDDRLITAEPWLVQTEEEAGLLYALMISKNRRTDICVFSLAAECEDPAATAASATKVHSKTLGAAHVAVLTGPAAFSLTDIVGKEFSVFNRAVRTYRPCFDTDADDPLRHPLALAHRIAAWQDNGMEGPEAFENFLARSAILQTVSGSDLERQLPPFSEVRRISASTNLASARDAGASNDELLRLYEDDNSKLRATLDEEKALHAGLIEEADRERDEAQRRAEEARSEVYRLNQRIRMLETQISARADSGSDVALPADLHDLKDWADRQLAGSVVLTNRALRGANGSQYEEPALVYRALLLLRDRYVPMRREGGDVRRQKYEAELSAIGLSEEGSITRTRLGEQGEEYLVQYNGKKRELDRHLRKGNARDPRHCFRLYFFWDEEDEQVVVGWLTSHLDTRQT
jgi:hypothetical protein